MKIIYIVGLIYDNKIYFILYNNNVKKNLYL